jgi:cyclopropane-fatty-acyl-phospholipid synthase
MSQPLTPYFEDVQAHYDLSDDFYRLFLDSTQTYSCAYFEQDNMSLEQAQLAKIDLSLGKLGLEPGMTLLDIGCAHVQRVFDEMDSPRDRRVLLEGWEQFDEPVDRIVSIGAFEHFGLDRYPAFFRMAYQALPADGVMLLHTITRLTFREGRNRGLMLTHELVEFSKFILAEIFPGGWLPSSPMVEDRATEAGFEVTQVQALQPHYARTLETWAANLEANRAEAVAIQSQEAYDRYMKYLTGCAKLFRQGYVDVKQFTLHK